LHGKAKKREGGWEVTIFGGLSGRDGGEGDIGVNLGWEVCFLGGNFLMSS